MLNSFTFPFYPVFLRDRSSPAGEKSCVLKFHPIIHTHTAKASRSRQESFESAPLLFEYAHFYLTGLEILPKIVIAEDVAIFFFSGHYLLGRREPDDQLP